MRWWILITSLAVAGCATQRATMVAPPKPSADQPVVREAFVMHRIETRYDVRAYRDPNDPGVRHDAHAVYRTTRVPARIESLETVPRSEFAPVSYAPLPASAEISAELATQRQITAELREIKSRMSAIEQQAQGQFGTLVNQTAETIKLREQLEAERARVRQLEAKLRESATAPVAAPTVTTAAADVKW